MNASLYPIENENIKDLPFNSKRDAISALEAGKIIYLPTLPFYLKPEEFLLLDEKILSPKEKNISFNSMTAKLSGYHSTLISDQVQQLHEFMERYAQFAHQLILDLLPEYREHLLWGRTSFRPAEIKNRRTSKRKDDTRLHVDSFAATPVYGKRILRVFCNINPEHAPRVWQTGESFTQVLEHFKAEFKPYYLYKAKWLKWLKITKTIRSPYDHFMLQLHDKMKLSDTYQNNVSKETIAFPSGTSWIVFTDQVSHAALSGQHLLEQTFYLPITGMQKPEHAPYSYLAKCADLI